MLQIDCTISCSKYCSRWTDATPYFPVAISGPISAQNQFPLARPRQGFQSFLTELRLFAIPRSQFSATSSAWFLCLWALFWVSSGSESMGASATSKRRVSDVFFFLGGTRVPHYSVESGCSAVWQLFELAVLRLQWRKPFERASAAWRSFAVVVAVVAMVVLLLLVRRRKKVFPNGERWKRPEPELYSLMKEILREARKDPNVVADGG
ncbi:hypothetical protein GGR58DRAFT_28432 [Xylaria digitata]|nr:hypothetical protein GGR58DRAFT_28432 [Xylaria digitata]